jgi:tetratricopeptide (TPR) repeat protein
MDIAEFTGRGEQLAQLAASLREADGTAVKVCAIVGMAGVGKTRLAIRAAHELTRDGWFPDVQLWADLHGFHPDLAPTDPAVVLERFLRALGVQAHDIPTDAEERAGLYRARLHGRRVLVVLDDAASEEQVRPVLPGSAGSTVLITSRRNLTGLDGLVTVLLGAFTTDEAIALMRDVVGAGRVDAEPAEARRIVDLCGHLPLAVAMASRHLRNRPTWRLVDLAARLGDDDRRLLQLSRGDRAVRQTFDVSYRSLVPEHRRLFRLLALHPGHEITAAAAAALAGVAVVEAETALELLLDEHVVQQAGSDRYRMHDLIRLYCTEQVRRSETEAGRQAAFVRLLEHYVGCAEQATLAVHPTEVRRLAPEDRRLPRTSAPFTGPVDAARWAEREIANLVTIVEHATESTQDCSRLALRLVRALHRPLANRGHSSQRIGLGHLAARIAQRLGDRAGEAMALEDLGTLCGQVGQAHTALDHSRRALALWTELGDQSGRQGCLADIGNVHRQRGEFTQATECLTRSLEIARQHGNRPGEGSVLNYLSLVHQRCGRFDEAEECLRRSREVYRDLGNRLGEAISLANLGWAQQRAGDASTALNSHQHALTIFRDLGDLYNEAEQLWGLGQAHHALGHSDRARDNWHDAIALLRDVGLLDSAEAAVLLRQRVPETPEIVRLNT